MEPPCGRLHPRRAQILQRRHRSSSPPADTPRSRSHSPVPSTGRSFRHSLLEAWDGAARRQGGGSCGAEGFTTAGQEAQDCVRLWRFGWYAWRVIDLLSQVPLRAAHAWERRVQWRNSTLNRQYLLTCMYLVLGTRLAASIHTVSERLRLHHLQNTL
jgi:hypothetical protein